MLLRSNKKAAEQAKRSAVRMTPFMRPELTNPYLVPKVPPGLMSGTPNRALGGVGAQLGCASFYRP